MKGPKRSWPIQAILRNGVIHIHPLRLLRRDIAEGISHVVVSDNKIVGTFVFIIGDEPTYSEIEGEWINDEPYGTIHRIASDGSVGVLPILFEVLLRNHRQHPH